MSQRVMSGKGGLSKNESTQSPSLGNIKAISISEVWEKLKDTWNVNESTIRRKRLG